MADDLLGGITEIELPSFDVPDIELPSVSDALPDLAVPEFSSPDINLTEAFEVPDVGNSIASVTDKLEPEFDFAGAAAENLTPEIAAPKFGEISTGAVQGNVNLAENGGAQADLRFADPESPLEKATLSAQPTSGAAPGIDAQLTGKTVELGAASLQAGAKLATDEVAASARLNTGHLGAEFEYDNNRNFAGGMNYRPSVGPVNNLGVSMPETNLAAAQSGFAPLDVAATAKPIALNEYGTTLNLSGGGTLAGLNPNAVKGNANLDFDNGFSLNGQGSKSMLDGTSQASVGASFAGGDGENASLSYNTAGQTQIAASVPIDNGRVYGSATLNRNGELDEALAGIKQQLGNSGALYAEVGASRGANPFNDLSPTAQVGYQTRW